MSGIKLAVTTADYPQGDGQTEKVNQELEQYLRFFINEQQDNWDDLLPLAEFQYNNHIHSATQQTPFMLDTGRHPRMGFEPCQTDLQVETVNEFKDQMEKSLEEAKSALAKEKDDMARYYNQRQTPAPEYHTGDRVFLDASDILPVLVDGQEHYVVEKILDSRFIWNHLLFLVKWEGYGYKENLWVSEEDLSALVKLQEFYRSHPGAPWRIHSTAFNSLNFHALRA